MGGSGTLACVCLCVCVFWSPSLFVVIHFSCHVTEQPRPRRRRESASSSVASGERGGRGGNSGTPLQHSWVLGEPSEPRGERRLASLCVAPRIDATCVNNDSSAICHVRVTFITERM